MLKVEAASTGFVDGIHLINLIEILSEKKLPKHNTKPKMRLHRLENISKALDFLQNVEKIKIVNIGPDDIEQGNMNLTLGLIWTLILHYQIGSETKEGSPKWELLQWVKEQCKPYGIGQDLIGFKKG